MNWRRSGIASSRHGAMKSHTSAGTRQQIAQSHVAKRTHRAEQKHQALDHDGSALLGVGSTLLQVCRSTLLHFIL